MGKSYNGIYGPISGRVGNLVWYTARGQGRVRGVGERTAKLTDSQHLNCNRMSVLMKLFKNIKPFLKVGFINETKGTLLNYHNVATACNKGDAISELNGQVVIDYPNLILSRGNALEPQQPLVEKTTAGLKFSWDYDVIGHWESRADQVMMMAYFPETHDAKFVISGARRSSGQDLLEIHHSFANRPIEIYISFVSDDRTRVATSRYLGRIQHF
jgi:hypothetical protein